MVQPQLELNTQPCFVKSLQHYDRSHVTCFGLRFNIAIVSARTLESMKLDMKELCSHLSPRVRLL